MADTETELRFAIGGMSTARLLAASSLAAADGGDAAERALHSVYWDTPSLDFRRAGVVVRTRRTSDGWQQAVKGAHERLHTTHEWEAPLRGDRPDLALAREAGWAAPTRLLDASPLAPRFETRIRRATRILRLPDDTRVEMAIDRGHVAVVGDPSRRVRLDVLELECLAGDVRHVLALAWRLAGEVPGLRLTFATKADAGYALLGLVAPPRRARPIALAAAESGAALAVRAAEGALAQMHGNVEGVLAARDAEYLHQLRVGLRRLRATVSLARAARLPTFSSTLRDELRWAWSALGPPRDLDVFAEATWRTVAEGLAPSVRAAVDAELAARLRTERAKLAATIASARFQRMLLAVAWVIEHQRDAVGRVSGGRGGQGPRALARQVLDRRLRRARKAADGSVRSAEARHRLRIAVKKLRYLAEACASLFDGRDARSALRSLSAMQDRLGASSDRRAGRALLASLLQRRAALPPTDPDADDAGEREDRRAARKVARRLRRLGAFWRD